MADEAGARSAVRIRNQSAESPVLHRVEIEVEASRVDKALDRVYRDLARQVKVRGFRPGKVPRKVLERMYGPSVSEQMPAVVLTDCTSSIGSTVSSMVMLFNVTLPVLV